MFTRSRIKDPVPANSPYMPKLVLTRTHLIASSIVPRAPFVSSVSMDAKLGVVWCSRRDRPEAHDSGEIASVEWPEEWTRRRETA